MDESMNLDLPGPMPDLQGFMSPAELKYLGFRYVGENTQISRLCQWYAIHPDSTIGDHVRIDDYCIFKGHVEIGSHVHVCAYSMVSGAQAKVTLEDLTILAAHCLIYTGSNDHTGDYLGAPQVRPEYTNQRIGPVVVGLGTLIGANVVILPNVHIGEAAGIGAGCTVSEDVPAGGMLRIAKPVLATRRRNVQRIMDLAIRFLENWDHGHR